MKIVIIDYKAGNIRSVQVALKRLGVAAVLSQDPAEIRAADRVIFPGVGSAGWAMEQLRQRELDTLIPQLTQPVLGICLGMQLLCAHSEEDQAEGLGVFPAVVQAIPADEAHRVPHMGWNQLGGTQDSPLLRGLTPNTYLYFVHSYAVPVEPYTKATVQHGQAFSAIIERDNFYATQFHPEKSGPVGAQILKNFIELK